MNIKIKHSLRVARAPELVIIGAGGHAISVANVAISAGYIIKNYIDKKKKGNKLLGTNIIGDISDLKSIDNLYFALAIGDNSLREKVYKELISVYPNIRFPALVHVSAVVSSYVNMGIGTVVMPQAVIGPNSSVGKFCIVNTKSSLDHDCQMKDFSSLAPGAVLGGSVKVGKKTAICIGAIVKHNITIGDNSVLGANSYLNMKLPNKCVAYGSPAKKVRMRNSTDTYLD